jgi:hypothetical protein
LARHITNLDLANFQGCLENQLSLGLVFRDLNLASANNIDSTPTLFVNGRRMAGVKDAAQLRQLIEDAKKDAQSAAATAECTGKTDLQCASNKRPSPVAAATSR